MNSNSNPEALGADDAGPESGQTHPNSLRTAEIDLSLLRHDFMAPLRAIDSLTDFISEDFQAGEMDNVYTYIDKIHRSVSVSRALVDGLSRYERALTRAPIESTSVARFIRAVVLEFQTDGDMTLVIDTHDIDDEPAVYIERAAIATCLQEMVANAITHRKITTGTVVVTAKCDDDQLMITVADDAAGIDPNHWEVIFEPLRRIHHVQNPDGVGMGLAIAKRTALTHNGSLRVERSSPRGSQFELMWPVSRPQHRPLV